MKQKQGDSVLLSPLIGLNIMLPLFDFPQVTRSHCLPTCLPACLLIANYLDPNYWRLVGWLVGLPHSGFAWDVQLLRFLSTIQIMTQNF
jgi:hypothetical protein